MSVFAAFFVAAALWSAVSQADIVMSLTKLTGDTAEDVEAQLTNVPNYSSVKYAINYGDQQVTDPIGGVTFVNQGGTNYYAVYTYTDGEDNVVHYGYNTPQQSFTSHGTQGTTSHGGNTYSGTQSAELNKLLGSMMFVTGGQYANTYATLTFGNLEEGKTYTARILTRSWGTNNPNRQHTFSIDLNADGVGDTFTFNGNQVTTQMVSEDQPFSGETYAGAYAVDFTFTAQSNTATINLLSGATSNQPWHNYGVMLIETSVARQAATPTIYNGSFEADTFKLIDHNTQHNYIDESNSGVISGWQFTNMTNTEERSGLAWKGGTCQHFLGNQTIPDGNQLAWLQSNKTDSRMYQNVYGFNPEDKDTVYRVSMELGTRGTNKPSFSLYIGEDQASEKAYISSKVVPSGKFTTYGAVFAPNAETQAIAIGNHTSGDNSLLIDNVQLQAYELTTFFSDNFNVTNNRKGSLIGMGDGDADDRFGGLLGPMAYKVSVASNDQIQVGNGDTFPQGGTGTCKGSLFFATQKDGFDKSHASPDYNFANVGAMTVAEEGGRMYDISFRVAPQYDEDASSTNWAAILFGLTEGKQTSANVSTGDGVGILFRRNGGIQIFDGTNNNAQIANLGAGTFTLTDDWADVRLVYYVPAFDGKSPVEVSLYVNDELISSFQTGKGFNANFIQLEAYSNADGYKRSLMDDLSIKATAEFYYDVSRIQDLNREWAPNAKDKLDVFFNAPRGDGSTNAVHTGAITLEDDVEIDVNDGYTLKQTGDVTGNHTITKTGDGVLQIYGAAAGDVDIQSLVVSSANCQALTKSIHGDVDIQSLVVSSGRVDVKGYMKGAVLVGEGATFSPGNSVGTVVIDGEFQTEALATLLFEQDASGMDSLTASSFVIDPETVFELDITAIVPGATYDIIISSDEDFTEADSVWLDKLSEIVPDYFDFSIVDNHIVRLYMNPNSVPEPSTWALLALGVCGLLYLRKRS
ncbi:MAG: PEP-CTERM sorting domain-containing protein [Thermoguttaceae bacterium]|nr:PEP-CTERM sorting domain-containing protein [Thermoguttaceae bacterium]